MKSALLATLWVIPFYFIGLFGCLGLFPLVLRNTHDGSVEAAMMGAFIFGPLFALLGFIGGFIFHRSRRKPAGKK